MIFKFRDFFAEILHNGVSVQQNENTSLFLYRK